MIKELSLCVKVDLCVLMIDVDRFKRYNDIYGHIEGDKCLQLVSDTLKNSLQKPRYIVARYGGEEFIALLPETSLEEATNISENIRRTVENLKIEHKGSKDHGVVTISIGVAIKSEQDTLSSDRFIDRADKALYRAKEGGRNRVAF